MSTIQQQLSALGPTFEVDGQKWEPIILDEGYVDGFSTNIAGKQIHIYPISETGNEITFNAWHLNGIELFGLVFRYKQFEALTIPDACRQALAICRERVSELAGALGMSQKPNYAELLEEYKEHSRTLVYAAAYIPIIKNNEGCYCFNGKLKDYIEVLGGNCENEYAANELLQGDFPYELIDKEGIWHYEFLLKFHTGNEEEVAWLELLHTKASYYGPINESIDIDSQCPPNFWF